MIVDLSYVDPMEWQFMKILSYESKSRDEHRNHPVGTELGGK